VVVGSSRTPAGARKKRERQKSAELRGGANGRPE
jgi:hypothetical protein